MYKIKWMFDLFIQDCKHVVFMCKLWFALVVTKKLPTIASKHFFKGISHQPLCNYWKTL